MSHCPVCNSEVPEQHRFCGACGSSVDPSAEPATQTSVPEDRGEVPTARGTGTLRPITGGMSGLSSSDGFVESRFLPGAMLAGRYRIVGLIGKGGMGEVYRADDLKLGQPVALKFLPEALERDPARLERFLNEVRVALQVSHANVCRVHDIGEFEGQHYLSMEYVDGEDLASLLRRIGRLPNDKAVEIARQICAGLAAAHARGIVHRDLKPANVMIDGRGHVRITDFGLAGLAEGIRGAEIRAGTPDYMAPEQLAGKEVSVKSDLYALGLVLYELFTGKRAFRADSIAELQKMQQSTPPPSPSSVVDGLDPAVERVILRCLGNDPASRPGSALAVAAALPGGDPLAAALAAGETPSPEMVAGAGEEGALRPWLAALLLVLALGGGAASLLFWAPRNIASRVPLEKPPAALAVDARETLEALGHEAEAADQAYGFTTDANYFRYVEENDESADRWDGLATVRPSPVLFWYRESPRPLVPAGLLGAVSPNNPPLTRSGMATLILDPQGQLVSFLAVPPELDEERGPPAEPAWSPLFERAGLDEASLQEVDPAWNPLIDCDRRAAWEGTYPGQPDPTMRVEAGSYQGNPVYFRVIAPWTRPSRMEVRTRTPAAKVVNVIAVSLMLIILVGGVLLARRNLRLGRGDQRGAVRTAIYVGSLMLLTWLLTTRHVASMAEVALIFVSAAMAMLIGGIIWMVYVALEPYVRRLWPHVMISWTRLLAGRFTDPLVGRDILIGCVAGGLIALVSYSSAMVPAWFDEPPDRPEAALIFMLNGMNYSISLLFNLQPSAASVPLVLLFLIVLLRVVLRKPWAAVGVTWLIMTSVGALQNGGGLFVWIFSAILFALVLVVIIRGGFLAAIAAFFVEAIFRVLPLTFDFSAWYAPWTWIVVAGPVALAFYGFWISLAGKPLFTEDLLQE